MGSDQAHPGELPTGCTSVQRNVLSQPLHELTAWESSVQAAAPTDMGCLDARGVWKLAGEGSAPSCLEIPHKPYSVLLCLIWGF